MSSEIATPWGNTENPSTPKVSQNITKDNAIVYIIVAVILGLISLITLIASIVFAYFNNEIPGSIIALGSVAVGALATLFTHK
jgi:hypothetical protein